MKIITVFVILLAILYMCSSTTIEAEDSGAVLDHIQGNNYNIYLLYFHQATSIDEVTLEANQDIEEDLEYLTTDNPDLQFFDINVQNPEFKTLIDTVEVPSTPCILLIVNGQGVWVYDGISDLIVDRINDFLPQFKEASAHHTEPYKLE